MFSIPLMLCSSLRDLSRLGDPRYVAEPKFDGQRAQIHVAEGRTAAAFRSAGRAPNGDLWFYLRRRVARLTRS